MKLIKPIILAFLLVGAVACSTTKKSAAPDNKADKTEQPVALSAELQQGHDLFTNNCGKCHKLPKPASLNPESWKKMVDIMAPKAKLDQTQADLVYKYLVN